MICLYKGVDTFLGDTFPGATNCYYNPLGDDTILIIDYPDRQETLRFDGYNLYSKFDLFFDNIKKITWNN